MCVEWFPSLQIVGTAGRRGRRGVFPRSAGKGV